MSVMLSTRIVKELNVGKSVTKNKPYSMRTIISIGSAAIGVCLLVVAALGIWQYLASRTGSAKMPTDQTLTQTTSTPSEVSPGPVKAEYAVPASQPRAIQIPELNLEAYVQRVGIDATNTMVAPDNIYFTGWYVGSVVPGEKGISIINGHAGGRYEQGIFRDITNLTAGESIRVQMGNLNWREFQVVSAKSYATSEANVALFKDDQSIEKELHLITCDGKFNDHTQTYDRRFIVVAKRV